MEQAGGSRPNSKIMETQAKVDEVVGIMRVNVEKVIERDQKLSELHDRAGGMVFGRNLNKLQTKDKFRVALQQSSSVEEEVDALQHGASQFEQQAYRLKRNMWLRNMKMYLIMGAIGGVLLIIIIVWISSSFSGSNEGK